MIIAVFFNNICNFRRDITGACRHPSDHQKESLVFEQVHNAPEGYRPSPMGRNIGVTLSPEPSLDAFQRLEKIRSFSVHAVYEGQLWAA